MKRMLVRVVMFAAMFAVAGAVVGVAPASATTTCTTGTPIVNAFLVDSVVVPAGQTCTIQNSSVFGSVAVQPGGALVVLGSSIYGNIDALNPQSIRIDALGPCTIAGNPNSCVRRTNVYGNVTANGTTGVPAGFAANYVCNGTTISGNLTVHNSGRIAGWDIGSTTLCSFGANTISGNATLTQNLRRIEFDHNSVGSSMTSSGNVGGGTVRNNTINANLQVTNPSNCWTVSGNTVHGGSLVTC